MPGDAAPIPLRWRLAAALRSLPEFRARDRLERRLFSDVRPPAGVHRGVFGPCLRFEASFGTDTALRELYLLQFDAPSLAPVLDAVLRCGDVFVDVGANIGVYAGWAARRVGSTGAVHAFEPVPRTVAYLQSFVALNELTNVQIVACAVGAKVGPVSMRITPGHSGISSVVAPGQRQAVADDGTEIVKVAQTTLDSYYADRLCLGAPRLIKIDVEGREHDVLRGAARLLSARTPPVVLFESPPKGEHAHVHSTARWLAAEVGYATYALTRSGLLPIESVDRAPLPLNFVALHADHHGPELSALRNCRFKRNQNC